MVCEDWGTVREVFRGERELPDQTHQLDADHVLYFLFPIDQIRPAWISMLVRFGNAKAGLSNGALVVQRLIHKINFKLKLTKIQIRFSVGFVTCLCNQCSFLHIFSHFLLFSQYLPWLKWHLIIIYENNIPVNEYNRI